LKSNSDVKSLSVPRRLWPGLLQTRSVTLPASRTGGAEGSKPKPEHFLDPLPHSRFADLASREFVELEDGILRLNLSAAETPGGLHVGTCQFLYKYMPSSQARAVDP